MEIQSGNGEEVASAAPVTSGCVSRAPPGPQVEVSDNPVLREDLQAAKRIERFDIPLDSLKRMFEKPAGATAEVTAFPTTTCKKLPSSGLTHPDPSTDHTMASPQDNALGSVVQSKPGDPEERALNAEDQEAEPVSVKERLAMYQAAVSKKESTSSPSAAVRHEDVMDDGRETLELTKCDRWNLRPHIRHSVPPINCQACRAVFITGEAGKAPQGGWDYLSCENQPPECEMQPREFTSLPHITGLIQQ